MNYGPPQPPQPPRSSRMPVLVALGVVAAIVLGSGLFVLKSWATARSELVDDGYTSPKVTFRGPFTFGFTATKGTSTCSGTMTRYPGSSSREETCFDMTPTAPPAPPTPTLTNRQQLEKSLEKNYAKYTFTRFTCPEVANADTKTTCSMAGDNGASVTVQVERTKIDDDGTWAQWTSAPDATLGGGADMSAELTQSVSEAAKTSHPSGVDVDCGKGPVVFTGGKASCTFTTRDKKPMTGKVDLTAKKDGGYGWKAKL